MLKFNFAIRTRSGPKVNRIVIIGRDQDEAERKLRQMYRQCDVLNCQVLYPDGSVTDVACMEHPLLVAMK